jgi:hypothetical protein
MGGPRVAARASGRARSGPLTVLAWLALAAPAEAAPALVKAGEFDRPTYATGPPGDASRIFVTERPGRVRVIRDGSVPAQPFLDLTAITESAYEERGLLSLVARPAIPHPLGRTHRTNH